MSYPELGGYQRMHQCRAKRDCTVVFHKVTCVVDDQACYESKTRMPILLLNTVRVETPPELMLLDYWQTAKRSSPMLFACLKHFISDVSTTCFLAMKSGQCIDRAMDTGSADLEAF